jgi:hypothetical protein
VFDPNDPETMNTPLNAERRLRRALHWAPLSVWLVSFAAAMLGELYVASTFDLFDRLPFAPALWFISAIVIAGFTRRRARRALIGPGIDPSQVNERFWRVSMLLVCLYIFFVMSGNGLKAWTCPHGSGWSFGSVGIAHSTVGGPCRNTVIYWKAWNLWGPWYVWVSS